MRPRQSNTGERTGLDTFCALKRLPAGLADLVAAWPHQSLAYWLHGLLQLGERPTPIKAIGMARIGAALTMLAWNPQKSERDGCMPAAGPDYWPIWPSGRLKV